MRTISKAGLVLTAGVLAIVFAAGVSLAKPGPVIAGFMERAEYHSKTATVESPVWTDDLYLYSILFLSRKLDTNFTGMVTYINKWGINEGAEITHIGNVSVIQDLTTHWKGTYAYSYVQNVDRTFEYNACPTDIAGNARNNPKDCPRTQSNWFNLSLDFNNNPKAKHDSTWKAGLAYNTATNLSVGRSLTGKLAWNHRFNKKWDYELAYNLIYGLNQYVDPTDPTKNIGKDVSANQYFATLNYKMSKKNKLSLGYLFVNNQYQGNQGDDSVVRLTFVRTFKTK